MEGRKLDVTLILSVLTFVVSVFVLMNLLYDTRSRKQQPIRRSFQNDDVLRRGKYAKRHTQWPLH